MNNNTQLTYTPGHIYGIYCYTTNQLYIGSTIQDVKTRLQKHLTDMRGYLGLNPKPRNYRSSFEVLYNNNYKIFKICECMSFNRNNLLTMEALYIYSNDCVNVQRPKHIRNIENYNKEDFKVIPPIQVAVP